MQSMQYILVIIWLLIAAMLGRLSGMHRKERVLGRVERRATWTYALLLALPLILFAGMRR